MKKVSAKDRAGNNGRNWSESVDLRSGNPWGGKKTDTVFGRTSKKPEEDDRPKRTPTDRNTGSSLAKKLAGKVIG
jgi:hypothetical protein